MLQVCRALEAAHSVGIIHRDLKPQNIMRDKSGRILVMDFGLARTLEGDGMTQTGALVGTMDYMSPEQALGKDLDQRSDLFTLGLIFYELLTGKMPYKADSVVASLLKRTQERAAPVSSHDASIPRPLSDIVSRCMDPDVKLRYESSSQIMADLEAWQGGRAAATLNFPSSGRPWGQTIPWHWIGGAATVLALALTGFLMPRQAVQAGSGPLRPPGFARDSAIPQCFRRPWAGLVRFEHRRNADHRCRTICGACARFSPDRVHQILNDLHMTGNVQFDPNTLRQVSESGNADTLISGAIREIRRPDPHRCHSSGLET